MLCGGLPTAASTCCVATSSAMSCRGATAGSPGSASCGLTLQTKPLLFGESPDRCIHVMRRPPDRMLCGGLPTAASTCCVATSSAMSCRVPLPACPAVQAVGLTLQTKPLLFGESPDRCIHVMRRPPDRMLCGGLLTAASTCCVATSSAMSCRVPLPACPAVQAVASPCRRNPCCSVSLPTPMLCSGLPTAASMLCGDVIRDVASGATAGLPGSASCGLTLQTKPLLFGESPDPFTRQHSSFALIRAFRLPPNGFGHPAP